MAALLSACRSQTIGTYPAAPVVLISIDTLRADHLPLYGYRAGATPAIDALGREGVVFEQVFSHCPLTLPAHASLLTGLLPPHHGVRDNIGFTLKQTHETLATRFKAAGFATGAAVSAYVLRGATGIAQGFDSFDDAIEVEGAGEALGSLQRDGRIAVDALTRFIDAQAGKRFFAFLHLYEPHAPYAPPERYRQIANPYDGEIAYADELVGRLLEHLKARGLYDRSLIALTSDHGEGLKQHGEAEHGVFLYAEAVHVPLVLRLPGSPRAGARVVELAAQVDIAATLLDLAGVPAAGLDGVSLRPALAPGGRLPERSVYSETLYPRYHFGWSELYAATDARYRYIRAPRPELFDRARDPGETRNLADDRRTTAAAMADWLGKSVGSGKLAGPEEVPSDVREKLQALGYVGSGSPVPVGGELPDAKDKIGSYEQFKAALGLREQGKDEEAVAAFRTVLADNPGMLDAWEMLGYTLIRIGRTPEGIAAIEQALKGDPTRLTAHLALAKFYALDGQLERAQKHAEIAAGASPGQGFELLAQMMMDRGDLAKATAFAKLSLAADDQRIMSHYILGVAAQRAGNYEAALAAFRRAERAKDREKATVVRNLHANIGDCLARLGREAEAEQEFQAEIREIPSSESGRVGMAMLYRSQARDQEAREVLAGLIAATPNPTADTYLTVVRTLSTLGDQAAARDWAARARAQFPNDRRFGGSGS